MKTTKKILAGVSLAWIVWFLTVSGVSAYRGDPTVTWPDYSEERHEAMQEAFETNDYEAWKELMDGKWRVTEVVTEENFEKFAEANKLAQEWNLEEAETIRQELGLWLRNGEWRGEGRWEWRWMGKWGNWEWRWQGRGGNGWNCQVQ